MKTSPFPPTPQSPLRAFLLQLSFPGLSALSGILFNAAGVVIGSPLHTQLCEAFEPIIGIGPNAESISAFRAAIDRIRSSAHLSGRAEVDFQLYAHHFTRAGTLAGNIAGGLLASGDYDLRVGLANVTRAIVSRTSSPYDEDLCRAFRALTGVDLMATLDQQAVPISASA